MRNPNSATATLAVPAVTIGQAANDLNAALKPLVHYWRGRDYRTIGGRAQSVLSQIEKRIGGVLTTKHPRRYNAEDVRDYDAACKLHEALIVYRAAVKAEAAGTMTSESLGDAAAASAAQTRKFHEARYADKGA